MAETRPTMTFASRTRGPAPQFIKPATIPYLNWFYGRFARPFAPKPTSIFKWILAKKSHGELHTNFTPRKHPHRPLRYEQIRGIGLCMSGPTPVVPVMPSTQLLPTLHRLDIIP